MRISAYTEMVYFMSKYVVDTLYIHLYMLRTYVHPFNRWNSFCSDLYFKHYKNVLFLRSKYNIYVYKMLTDLFIPPIENAEEIFLLKTVKTI